ncbi:putative beta-barrel porin [Ichthyenterobacterium magnum]|uniref:Putative beta-barrel porin n=1 Tax=Ichthyenterobacterium magnum TaxID=1230530 RepID=A0A420DFN0_9FLAO|nr:putative beta-barrel porin [Ichthyenterobacterium magnum]
MINKVSIIVLFFILCQTVFSQKLKKKQNLSILDSSSVASRRTSNNKTQNTKATIDLYKIISHERDTTIVDTTLSIKKEYKFNYLRKDNFGLMPFANMGQTYNTLSYNIRDNNLMPSIGAKAKHFNYMEVEDINYYQVPTPLTELFYKSAFQQGQVLDAFFTVNTSKQFNFSIAYKGMRSLGKYQHILASTGNFRITTSFKSKNERYVANAHMVTQDILNQENGGLTDENVEFFESGEESFLDRGVLEVSFQDAENLLKGKRFYLNHSYDIITKTDSTSNNKLKIEHVVNLDDKFYQFDQSTSNTFFGDAFKSTNLRDKSTLENFYNQLKLNYSNNVVGNVQFNVSHNNYNYGYDKLVFIDGNEITNRLKGNIFSLGGKYKKQINKFLVIGEFGINVSGDFEGNFINAEASYVLNKDIEAQFQVNKSSKAPNYNTLLYQSNYTNYNWQNNFNNIETFQFGLKVKSNKYLNLDIDFSTIDDYIYFSKDDVTSTVKPFQNNNESISYLRVKIGKSITYKKFTLVNNIMYQNSSDQNSVFNVPEFITRNTLYYSNHLFKKAMFLQTGITLNYFTEYNMNAYDPLLAEFYVQNETKFGGFPMLDFFINAKIRQTRIFLKAEHFNSSFTGYNYYSAPNHPYRDFTVRFGIVWNFFL